MTVRLQIVDGPLGRAPNGATDGAGALVVFEGIVRGFEDDREILGLDYTAYEPMAHTVFLRIAKELLQQHGLLGLQIEHSRGFVPVGQISFRLIVAAAHRKEAIAAMDEFIDRMKRDVPIWKRAVPVERAASVA